MTQEKVFRTLVERFFYTFEQMLRMTPAQQWVLVSPTLGKSKDGTTMEFKTLEDLEKWRRLHGE